MGAIERITQTIAKYKPLLSKIAAGFGTDIRSAAVGAVFGALTAFTWNQYQESSKTKLHTTGETGIGYPALLFDLASKEGHFQFTFKPPSMKKIAVCEYDFDLGHSYSELTLNYLKKYSDCFVVRRAGEKDIEITPNGSSGTLLHRKVDDTFWCKCCSAEVTGTGDKKGKQ